MKVIKYDTQFLLKVCYNGHVSMYSILKEIFIKVIYLCKYVTNFIDFDIKL